jgi:enediyne biosynthesis protein E4
MKTLWMKFFLILLFVSCSNSKTKTKSTLSIEDEVNQIAAPKKSVDFGPTISRSSSFIDRTDDYGLGEIQGVAFYAVDLNQDSWSDLVILPEYYSSPRFYLYEPMKKKFEKWENDPFPQPIKASFLIFADMNNDGVVDVLTAVLNQKSELSKIPVEYYLGEWRDKKISFKKSVGLLSLSPEPTSSISLLDVNLDGRLDFFMGNWFQDWKGKLVPTSDRLLIQTEKGFVESTDLLKGENVKTSAEYYSPSAKPTYGSSTCDVDQNGYPDIMTTSSAGYANKLWMNLPVSGTVDRQFNDIGMASGYGADPFGLLVATGGGRTFFSACTDYNDDGIMDIFLAELTHAYDHDGVDRSSILSGSKLDYPPSFVRTEYLREVQQENWNQGDKRGVWWDYNMDTRIDLLVDNSGFPPESRLVLFEQDETKAFSNVSREHGIDVVNPTGTILIDVNQDGKLDILTGQNNIRASDIKNRVYLFENVQPLEKIKRFRVTLEGKQANRDAIGSMIQLYYIKGKERIVQRRWYEFSQGGQASQNEKGLWFGVPSGHKFVGFKVRWPSKQTSSQRNGVVLEKMYPIDESKKDFRWVKLCEAGAVVDGPATCP